MMNDGDIHWDNWLAKREEVRAQVARFINAEPDEIGFTNQYVAWDESNRRRVRDTW